MFSVYQHWDPLKTCVVGRSYPPEFYSWIKNAKTRELFERIAIETEEDYLAIISKLQEFNVEVLRPGLPQKTLVDGRYIPPPMTPRDHMVMVGDRFIHTYDNNSINQDHDAPYRKIFEHVAQQGNRVEQSWFYAEDPALTQFNGAMLSRIGKDLYIATYKDGGSVDPAVQNFVDGFFPDTRNHIVNTGGHGDGCYCPVAPGLIISIHDVPTYEKTFPDWEVVYIENQSWEKVQPFLDLKNQNHGKWWIPGYEKDQGVINTVETWLRDWVGYVEETVFDVNMLVIDPKNVMVFNYNEKVFEALNRYNITPHVVPFRHRYFWDGGIHCITLDLDREGKMHNYFPNRQ